MRKNMHAVIPNPHADPRDRARVERAIALVTEINASPEARSLDPTGISIAVHVASEWLGKTRGFGAPLSAALAWMADHGRMRPDVTNRCLEVFGDAALPPSPPKNRHQTQRTHRFHRNWS